MTQFAAYEYHFYPRTPSPSVHQEAQGSPIRSPAAPSGAASLAAGNFVPLTSLPEIQGGRVRLALRRSPAGARVQQQQEEERWQRQLQDAPSQPHSALAPGHRASSSQPHAVLGRSRVQLLALLAGNFPALLECFSKQDTESQALFGYCSLWMKSKRKRF